MEKTVFNRSKPKVILVMLTFIFLLSYSPLITLACSCVEPDGPKESLEQSSAVFSGKVIEIVDKNKNNPIQSSADPIVVKFQVEQSWKGINQTEVIVYTVRDSASCGYEFGLNNDYLVYAHEVEGQLEVTICSRTNLLALSKNDLDELGEGKKLTEQEVIEIEEKKPKEQVVIDIEGKNIFSQLTIVLFITGLAIGVIFIVRKRKKRD